MKKVATPVFVLLMLLGIVSIAWAGQVFPDVPSGHWAEKDIAEMKAKGIVAGLADGYHPNDSVTREQAIVMIVKAIGRSSEAAGKKLPINMKNADSISTWAKEPVALAIQLGIISGSDLADFRPKDATRRYEMAVFIGRALGYTAADFNASPKLNYPDAAQIPDEAKGFVAAVTDEGIMGGLSDGSFQPNEALNRAQMAALLAKLDAKLNKLSDMTIEGEIFSVSTTSRSLLVQDRSGLIQTIQLTSDAFIYKNQSTSITSLAKGDQVLLVVDTKGQSAYIEVVSNLSAPVNPAAQESEVSGETAASSVPYYIGKIETLNTKVKVIMLRNNATGSLEQVLLASDTYIIKYDDEIPLSRLKVGNSIFVAGEIQAGLFIATSIVFLGE